MITDPIADYLTRIRNAARARHESTSVPYSKIKEGISKVLVEKKFIEKYDIKSSEGTKEIVVLLKKWEKEPITLKRISKPGQRIYLKSKNIRKIKSGLGLLVMSTPKGIMSGGEARKQKLGGEVLCEIY